MSLTLYNTRTRQKEPFVPLQDGRVTMYVCGPTVYSYPHIGNARPAVVFDVLARLLRTRFKLTYARNITDIDDKINKAAAEQRIPIGEIAARFTAVYREDMAGLGVAPPDLEPLATEHVPDIIAMIGTLIDGGHAYAAEGHVLFRVRSYADYGALSGRDRRDLLAGARVEVAPYKEDAGDFVLWKPSTPELPGWDSPWGRGRPGWHIECSAMVARHINRSEDPAERLSLAARLRASGNLLGLLGAEPDEWLQGSKTDGLSAEAVEALLAERLAARKNRDFAAADRIRDELVAAGIVILDGPEGTRWRRTAS